MSAELDLPWYFGSGSSTRSGDAGLRSTLGSQLEHVKGSRPSKAANREAREMPEEVRERLKRWQKRLGTASTFSVSAIEDDLHKRISFGGSSDAARISSKLSALTSIQVRALQLHFSGKSLPYAIDPCAVLLVAAKRLCGIEVEPFASQLRRALMKAKPDQIEQLEHAATELFTEAVQAYERAPADVVRTVQVNDPRPWKR